MYVYDPSTEFTLGRSIEDRNALLAQLIDRVSRCRLASFMPYLSVASVKSTSA